MWIVQQGSRWIASRMQKQWTLRHLRLWFNECL